eukprot:GFUD01006510.1.p1 GENE.GFUD01006510.1~~GFUD01006510.1.p1  ORF type:complete len:454 (+),score=106.44 GFUD01006510.1:172-1533(+)
MRLKSYTEQNAEWPEFGQHILAYTDTDTVTVYQAFKPSIAEFAVKNQKFGGSDYSLSRMTWIKTNFLWMMHRSNWGRSKNQEKVLAIHICKEGFLKILSRAFSAQAQKTAGLEYVDVRLQWDPDHDPAGKKERRRAIQLGLRGETLEEFNNTWIVGIEDISSIVEDGLKMVVDNKLDMLMIPEENVYDVRDEAVIKRIGLDQHNSLEQDQSQSPRKIILALGGSFNPVHKHHIQIMVKSKQWLEENTDFQVVAGILVVTTGNYLKQKFRKDETKIMTDEHRMNLCKLACEAHSDWLMVHPVPCVSGWEAGMTYREKDGSLLVGMVKGADKYNKTRRTHWTKEGKNKNVRVDVILGRGEVTDRMNAEFQEDLLAGLVVNKNYFIIPENVGDLSSTEVRKVIDRADSDKSVESRQELAMMLSEPLADYILKHLIDLHLSEDEKNDYIKENWKELL